MEYYRTYNPNISDLAIFNKMIRVANYNIMQQVYDNEIIKISENCRFIVFYNLSLYSYKIMNFTKILLMRN